MPELFGLDIAAIVDESIERAGGVLTGTLTSVDPGTRDAGDVTGGTNPTETDYSFRGFIDNKTKSRRGESEVSSTGRFVSILGNSLPEGVEPKAGDFVTIEDQRYRVLAVVERDPAAALYVVAVEL